MDRAFQHPGGLPGIVFGMLAELEKAAAAR